MSSDEVFRQRSFSIPVTELQGLERYTDTDLKIC